MCVEEDSPTWENDQEDGLHQDVHSNDQTEQF